MTDTETSKTNVPEFSVSDLAFSLKKTLEENYGRVRVRGELSRVSIAASGHMYSSLKDDGAVIDAVCWKGVLSKINIQPEEGLEVICTGRISTFPARSNYQLIIETMELAGQGALLKMLEERKRKLAAEGLFAPERKQDVPFLPEVIGVVTSPTGAVIRDILHRLADRFPRHVMVWPVVVQGETAAEKVADAINGFQSIDQKGYRKPDVLIVARGGGSLEDLMPFNEEVVVRAAANSSIPLISAVGHETDTTLIDYAADLRAPTPTGAAEMAVPVRENLLAQVRDDENRLVGAVHRHVTDLKNRLDVQTGRLGDPLKLLDGHTQKLDHLGDKMNRVFDGYVSVKRQKLIESSARLRHPKDRIVDAKNMLDRWSEQLHSAGTKLLGEPEKKLEYLSKMLETLSFENVLARGYAVVQDSTGALISSADQTQAGQAIQIRFQKLQQIDAVVGNTQSDQTSSSAPRKKAKSSQRKTPDKDQGSLF